MMRWVFLCALPVLTKILGMIWSSQEHAYQRGIAPSPGALLEAVLVSVLWAIALVGIATRGKKSGETVTYALLRAVDVVLFGIVTAVIVMLAPLRQADIPLTTLSVSCVVVAIFWPVAGRAVASSHRDLPQS